ncbi:hypothetical protein DRW07_02520 [Alteromonas sediminis]|uniref:Type II secretion system protein M n=1 Tax=Alteromonas sediminis TaxID=2259342 RepID=A0A3N5Y488_9ALTE|nr:hypothetical protein [Alteromonas sediminis]RPJ68300.1 hypothetical protein DRW07_02520 [Alteromonas sediminis]
MDALKEQFTEQWLEAKQQIASNVRLRVSLWIMLFIVLVYPALVLHDYKLSLDNEITKSLEREARVLRTANESAWFERAEKAKETSTQIERYFWQAESAGIAKATLLQTLNEWTTQSGFSNAQVRLEEPFMIEGQDSIYRIAGQIDITFEAKNSMALLEKIESNEKKIIIESMEIAQRTRPVHKLVIAAYFQVERSS